MPSTHTQKHGGDINVHEFVSIPTGTFSVSLKSGTQGVTRLGTPHNAVGSALALGSAATSPEFDSSNYLQQSNSAESNAGTIDSEIVKGESPSLLNNQLPFTSDYETETEADLEAATEQIIVSEVPPVDTENTANEMMNTTRRGPRSPPTLEEVERLLDVAHAERDVRYAEEALVQCRVKETMERTRLLRVQASIAAKKSKEADLHVGHARYMFNRAYRTAWSDGSAPCRSAPPTANSSYADNRRYNSYGFGFPLKDHATSHAVPVTSAGIVGPFSNGGSLSVLLD